MQFEVFQKRILEGVSEFLGDKATVQIKEVVKNNGVRLHGLIVLEEGYHIAPTIYLESFYESYLRGKEIGNIVWEIITFCGEKHPVRDLNMEFFTDYEKVKNRIMVKLVNREKNQELLGQVPFVPFLNLALVFYYSMVNEFFGNGSILIYQEHLDTWNVDVDTLYQNALENTKQKLGCQILNMRDVVTALWQEQREENRKEKSEIFFKDMEILVEEVEQALKEAASDNMYVLTNKDKYHGAVCMLYEDFLNAIAQELGKNLYILPSSIHEVILVPDTGREDAVQLSAMVAEVNATQLEPEEVLSDNVYYYDRDAQKTILL